MFIALADGLALPLLYQNIALAVADRSLLQAIAPSEHRTPVACAPLSVPGVFAARGHYLIPRRLVLVDTHYDHRTKSLQIAYRTDSYHSLYRCTEDEAARNLRAMLGYRSEDSILQSLLASSPAPQAPAKVTDHRQRKVRIRK